MRETDSLATPRKARYCLFKPIGCLLLCAYGTKHRLRRGLFVGANIALPRPWVQLKDRLGSPMQFVNTEAQTATHRDPRLRAFVSHALKDKFGTRGVRTAYIQRYNANPAGCGEYWGHDGRQTELRPRKWPLYRRLLYIGTATYAFGVGSTSAFEYPAGAEATERYDGLPDTTPADYERLERLAKLNLDICAAIAPLAVLVPLYATLVALSVYLVGGRETDAVRAKIHVQTDADRVEEGDDTNARSQASST